MMCHTHQQLIDTDRLFVFFLGGPIECGLALKTSMDSSNTTKFIGVWCQVSRCEPLPQKTVSFFKVHSFEHVHSAFNWVLAANHMGYQEKIDDPTMILYGARKRDVLGDRSFLQHALFVLETSTSTDFTNRSPMETCNVKALPNPPAIRDLFGPVRKEPLGVDSLRTNKTVEGGRLLSEPRRPLGWSKKRPEEEEIGLWEEGRVENPQRVCCLDFHTALESFVYVCFTSGVHQRPFGG